MKKIRRKVYQYTAIFELNEGGEYTVTVPALTGFVTERRNLEESRAIARGAISCYCYIEGLKRAKEKAPEEKEVTRAQLTVAV